MLLLCGLLSVVSACIAYVTEPDFSLTVIKLDIIHIHVYTQLQRSKCQYSVLNSQPHVQLYGRLLIRAQSNHATLMAEFVLLETFLLSWLQNLPYNVNVYNLFFLLVSQYTLMGVMCHNYPHSTILHNMDRWIDRWWLDGWPHIFLYLSLDWSVTF